MNENINIDLNIDQPRIILIFEQINIRLKLLNELNIELLAALSKENPCDITNRYNSKWESELKQKFGVITKP